MHCSLKDRVMPLAIILNFVRIGTVLLYVVQAGVVTLCESVYKFRSANRKDHCCVLCMLSS